MGKRARIMVVDDEERIRSLLLDYFEDYDEFDLTASASAEEALDALAAQPADLCVVDMRLPGMNGEQFILRAQDQGLCGTHLLHTGSVDFALTPELQARGFGEADVFMKPCDMERMLARIREKLSLKGDGGE